MYDGHLDQRPDDLKTLTKEQKHYFDELDNAQRRDVVNPELQEYFSTLPWSKSAKPGDNFARNGAALVVKHMGNESIARAETLHFVMSTILDTDRRSKDLTKRLLERFSASPDVVMHAMLDAVVSRAEEKDRRKIETLGIGAIVKASRERLEAGKPSRADVVAMHRVFDRIFG